MLAVLQDFESSWLKPNVDFSICFAGLSASCDIAILLARMGPNHDFITRLFHILCVSFLFGTVFITKCKTFNSICIVQYMVALGSAV